jgi:hypothetical protein
VRATRTEAIDLFRKWESEGTLLRCDFNFEFFAACLRGKIRAVSGERLRLSSDDDTSELNFIIPESPDFGYAEPRNGTPADRELFGSGLVLLLDGEDMITFLEIIDSAKI